MAMRTNERIGRIGYAHTFLTNSILQSHTFCKLCKWHPENEN